MDITINNDITLAWVYNLVGEIITPVSVAYLFPISVTRKTVHTTLVGTLNRLFLARHTWGSSPVAPGEPW